MAHWGEASTRGPRRILVVDPDPRTRAHVVKALHAANDLSEADGVLTALGTLAARRGQFDVVILACRGAERSHHHGCVEIVRTVFKRWPWIPIVVISESKVTSERLVADMLVSGARDFLRSPFSAAQLRGLVERIVRRLSARMRIAPDAIATVKRIRVYIGDYVVDVPSLAHLAAQAAMSRSHFSRTFHAVTGMPLRDYIRDLRLKHATELLLGSPASLTTIAVDAGFYDLPHFDKAFRQRIGLAPQEFRRRYALARRGRGTS
jgi:AraC-like DNA-binding protein